MIDREKGRALDQDLKRMFRALQSRRLPDRVRCVLDQLEVATPARRKAG